MTTQRDRLAAVLHEAERERWPNAPDDEGWYWEWMADALLARGVRVVDVETLADRGTMTILPNGCVVVGMAGVHTNEDVELVNGAVSRWLRAAQDEVESQAIVFPWPVDIVDMRSEQ